VIKKNTIL